MRKLLRKIAWLDHGAIARRSPGFQPSESAHLPAVGELTAEGREVVCNGTGYETQRFKVGNRSRADEVKHHVCSAYQRVFLSHLNVDHSCSDRFYLFVEHRAGISRLIRCAEQISRSLRVRSIRAYAAIDQRLDLSEAAPWEHHARAHLHLRSGKPARGVEIGTEAGGVAPVSAKGRIVSEGECAGDRHATHAIGCRPH